MEPWWYGPTILAMVSRRRIIAVFVTGMCVPAATVLWLAGQLLQPDRQLETHYSEERRDQAADRAVRSLQVALSQPSLFQAMPQASPGAGAILINYPAGQMLFRPEAVSLPEAPAEAFRDAEAMEYQGNLEEAAQPDERRRFRPRHAIQRYYPGSLLSFVSGSAIKRIIALRW